MTKLIKLSSAALFAMLSFGSGALASEPDVQIAQSACQSIGQRTAANAGATLLAVSETTINGAPACEVVMLMPAENGARSRREVVVVPR